MILFAPPAQDLAAHVYRASLVSHGVLLWDNYWYTGTYPLATYSLLAPVALGAARRCGAASWCARPPPVRSSQRSPAREWGRDARWPSRAFAAAAALPLLPGLDAYVLGVPLLLAAVAALQRGRSVAALVCSALTLAASPLAFLFLVGVVAADLARGRVRAWRARRRRGGLAALAGARGGCDARSCFRAWASIRSSSGTWSPSEDSQARARCSPIAIADPADRVAARRLGA